MKVFAARPSKPPEFLLVGVDALDARAYQVYGRHNPKRPLRSLMPYTGPSWTTIYTGLISRVHGVVDPWGEEKDGSKGAKEYGDKCIWSFLQRAGITCGIFNMPVTYPTTKPLAFYVGGFPYLDEQKHRSNPGQSELHWHEAWEIEEANTEGTFWDNISMQQVIARLRESQARLSRNFAQQAQRSEVGFAAIGYRFPDRLGHIYGSSEWEWAESERLSVELVDDLVDLLLSELQPRAWLIVSDHGIKGFNHTDLGTIVAGGELEGVLDTRRWWNTLDPFWIIADYFKVSPPEVPRFPEETHLSRVTSLSLPTSKVAEKIAVAQADESALRLNLGSGSTETQQKGPDWLNIDIVPHEGVDIIWDLNSGLPFADESVDEVIAFDVLEHLSYHVAGYILGEWCRVLKPGGVITLRSPDLGAVAKAYAAGEITQLALNQSAYGRACSLDWDTHHFGMDWGWLVGQLDCWGCVAIQQLPDPDPYALKVTAVKEPGSKTEPKAAYDTEERLVMEKRLEALGYV